MNLYQPLSFNSIPLFVTEAIFGALLEISDTFGDTFCSGGLINILESFITIVCDFGKHTGW